MKFSSVVGCALLVAVALLLGAAMASQPQPCDTTYCRDDGLCPQYFRGICGSYKEDYMLFAGSCHMDNHNCRTCSEYKEVDNTHCRKKS